MVTVYALQAIGGFMLLGSFADTDVQLQLAIAGAATVVVGTLGHIRITLTDIHDDM